MNDEITFLILQGWKPMEKRSALGHPGNYIVCRKEPPEAIYYTHVFTGHGYIVKAVREEFDDVYQKYMPCEWADIPDPIIADFLRLARDDQKYI